MIKFTLSTFKRMFLLLSLAMISLSASSQNKWSCESLAKDIAKWNEVKSAAGTKNKKTATALVQYFGLNNSGKLSVDYVIQCEDSIGEEKIMNSVEAWLAELFPKADNSIIASNKNDHSVVVRGMSMGKVGEALDFISMNTIRAAFEIEVYVKVNRVRVIMRSNEYKVTKTSNSNGALLERYSTAMANAFPFNQKSDHKDSYAMAYLNTYSKLFNYAGWLVNYLNANCTATSNSPTVGDDW